MNVAINQPCYLPWRGYLALIKLVDVFVFYDDVSLPHGRSFQTRVQFKTRYGKKWLTVPVVKVKKQDQKIMESQIVKTSNWKRKHYQLIKDSLSKASYWADYNSMIRSWFDREWENLADLTINTTLDIVNLLNLDTKLIRSSELGVEGGKTERLVAICKELGAAKYISPLGSMNYLKHKLFEDTGIEVEYINYDNSPYPQQYGEFDPFVTIIDLLANVGPDANNHIRAGTIPWREMVAQKANNV